MLVLLQSYDLFKFWGSGFLGFSAYICWGKNFPPNHVCDSKQVQNLVTVTWVFLLLMNWIVTMGEGGFEL